MNKWKVLLAGIFVALLVLSCSLPDDVPEVVPSETPTITPSPTITPTPTETPTPTLTPTPIPAVRIANADRAFFNGDWDRAIEEYQVAYDSSNDSELQSASLLGIGRANLKARNYYQAIEVLEELISLYPDSSHLAHAHFFQGQAYDALEHYSDAAQAYLNYMILRPGVIDAYILELRGDALFAAGDYAEAANDYQAALGSPSLLDSIFLQLKMARAYAVYGDIPTALTLYDDVYYRTNNENTRALIDLRKGQAFTALGQTDQAHIAYLDAVVNYPTAYESYSALVALVEEGAVVDELNRGLVDYFAGEYGVALSAFDRYLQQNPADPGTAYYYLGLTTRALGGYQDAVNQWDQIIENYPNDRYWDDAWEQKAYTQWAYLDQYTLATDTLLTFVEKAPEHPRAAEFLFDAAQVAERAAIYGQAAELWERVINLYPNYELAGRALFLAGITQYRQEDYLSAVNTFRRYSDTAVSLSDRSAAYLWMGKAQAALGDNEAARASWEQGASTDPTGYYSERARDLLHDRAPFAPPLGYDLKYDEEAERIRAEEWLRTTFNLPADLDLSGPGPLAADPNIIRGTELWRLGLYNEARSEFEFLRQSLTSDPELSYRLVNYLVDLGSYRTAVLAARQVLDLALMDDASTLSAPAYFNYVRFGAYYSDLLIPVAQEYEFHPIFLLSVIRQESLFESFVRSSAAASGLMQIIPSTGAEIAGNMGWPPNYTSDDLYRPVVSLNFGADYLDTQRNTFEGDLYAVLAAYNGGPGNSNEWRKLAPDDPDLFLEVVRYEETRNYIRGIAEIFNLYRLIYDRTP